MEVILEKYFYCYSRPLKIFLRSKGFTETLYAIHPKTKKKYWVFNSCEELNKALTEWRNRK